MKGKTLMTILSRKICYPYLTMCLILLLLSVACQAAPIADGQAPTLDVGEEPPSQLPTATHPSQSLIVGPALYPTPLPNIIPWEQLGDWSSTQDTNWQTYQGDLSVKQTGSNWCYWFLYPTGWYESPNPGITQGFVQNIPLTQRPAPAEFIKFEIVLLEAPPMVADGQTLDLDDLTTVEMAGGPGILVSVTHQPDQAIQHVVFFQHDGVWLAATVYINLPVTDAAMLDRYSAVIFYIMSSFDIADQ
jgi:hypothetical protein